MDDGMIKAIQSLKPVRPVRPLEDEETRAWLKEHGFDLTKPITWWDTDTDCRHFVQSDKAIFGLP